MTRRAASKHKSKRKTAQPPSPATDGAKRQSGAKRRACWRMRNVQRLVRAIFAANDPIRVAGELLKCNNQATKAKIFALLFEYLYGKPVQQIEANGPDGERGLFQFVTHAPRPQRPVDPHSEDQRNKEMCRTSLSGAEPQPRRGGTVPPERAVPAAPTVGRDSNEEDEND